MRPRQSGGIDVMGDQDEDIFVGQVIALLPLGIVGHPPSREAQDVIDRMFPRSPPAREEAAPGSIRRRTYPVIFDRRDHGTLSIGTVEVEVAIMPLTATTPRDATVFRIVALSGRAMYVTGTVQTDPR